MAYLHRHARVLPLTVIKHRARQGYAHSLEELLRLALQRTDRPKRDCAITLHADFVLTGRCTLLGDQLIVHAELFDARRCEVVHYLREVAALASLMSTDSPIVRGLLAQIGQALLARQVDLARRCALRS